VFSLTDHEYQRWLELEAEEHRPPADEAELQGYLDAIATAEDQVRRRILDYLRAEHRRYPNRTDGADRADIYHAVAPRLPAAWGARMVARVHGECRHRDDVFAGKMLILDEALLALCASGKVEIVCDPVGDTTFRWSPDPEATLRRQEQQGPPGRRPQARPEAAPLKGPGGCPSPAATAAADLRALLGSPGAFIGSDE
jgi:hypothetical protein